MEGISKEKIEKLIRQELERVKRNLSSFLELWKMEV